MPIENHHKSPIKNLILLIVAGETIFILPFVLARVFRPTFLAVFELSNLDLGSCFSIYGITALISYFAGGPLADRFSPKTLMGTALILTSMGGLITTTYPSLVMLQWIYGYWGFTTIFLFWAAMIKSTRVWGGSHNQGKAFGWLDGGRGLVAALIGSVGILIFSNNLTGDTDAIDNAQSRMAFRYVLWFSSIFVGAVGLLVLLFMKEHPDRTTLVEKIKLAQVKQVLKLPAVWLLMLVVLCAYVGYKITDIFPQYAHEIMQYNEVQSAQLGTVLLYLRPVVGVFVGFLADRSKPSLWITIGFATILVGSIMMASGILMPSTNLLFLITTLCAGLGVYAVRALYFAVLQEVRIPLHLTGTAVGVISAIGFTPDIFVGPLTGYFLDNFPGMTGFQYVFGSLAGFSLAGLLTGVGLRFVSKY